MRVKELADILDIPSDTIRYYTRIGLIKPGRQSNGYRAYGQRELRVLKFCICAKRLGFSLKDIATIVTMSEHGETPCPAVRHILAHNLESVKRKLMDCQLLLARMEDATELWSVLEDAPPNGDQICKLIDEWEGLSIERPGDRTNNTDRET